MGRQGSARLALQLRFRVCSGAPLERGRHRGERGKLGGVGGKLGGMGGVLSRAGRGGRGAGRRERRPGRRGARTHVRRTGVLGSGVFGDIVFLENDAVLRFCVASQVHLSLEGSTALLAGEGFEARVLAAVGDEVGGLRESLATLPAYIRLFT